MLVNQAWLEDQRGEEICDDKQLRETLAGNEITPRNASITTGARYCLEKSISNTAGTERNSVHVLFAFHCSMKS